MINLFDYDKCADKERGKSLGGIGYLMKAKTCTHYIKANNMNMFMSKTVQTVSLYNVS